MERSLAADFRLGSSGSGGRDHFHAAEFYSASEGLLRELRPEGWDLPPRHYHHLQQQVGRYPAVAPFHSEAGTRPVGVFDRGVSTYDGGYNTRRDVKGVGSVVGVRYGFGLGRHAPRSQPPSEPARLSGRTGKAVTTTGRAFPRASDTSVEHATIWPSFDIEQALRPNPALGLWQRDIQSRGSGNRMSAGAGCAHGSRNQAGFVDNGLHHDVFMGDDIPTKARQHQGPQNVDTDGLHARAVDGFDADRPHVTEPLREEVASASPQCAASASDDGSESCDQERAAPAAVDPGLGPGKKKRGRKPIQGVFCRIPTCCKRIGRAKMYYFRRRMCEGCLNQQSVLIEGREMRFCQQCSQLHPISEFDGMKRSCRWKLESHKVRAKGSRRRKADSGSAADVTASNNTAVIADGTDSAKTDR